MYRASAGPAMASAPLAPASAELCLSSAVSSIAPMALLGVATAPGGAARYWHQSGGGADAVKDFYDAGGCGGQSDASSFAYASPSSAGGSGMPCAYMKNMLAAAHWAEANSAAAAAAAGYIILYYDRQNIQ